MSLDITPDSFRRLYSELRFIDVKGNPLPLYSSCCYGNDCWSGPYESKDRKPADDRDAAISRPWVGSQYPKLGLLVVGINQNQCGGDDSLDNLVTEARKELSGGDKKVTFQNPEYRGTFLWHRIGCYATAFLEAKGIYDREIDVDGYPRKEKVEFAYDYIAYTNHVKCSPNEDNSKPSNGMWEHCGHHVLRREIALLKPTDILLLGKGENLIRLQSARILDCPLDLVPSANGLVRRAKSSIGGMPIRVFVVPHPTRGPGLKKEVLSDLRELLKL